MNLWVKNLGLILGLALLFFSCEDPEEVGLELNPDAGKFKSAFAEIPVRVGQIQAEPYYTTDTLRQVDFNNQVFPRVGKLLLGRSVDQDFGTTTATAFAQIQLLDDSLVIDEDAGFNKIELKLYINDFYGDDVNYSEEQTFYVHELNEEIDDVSFSDDQYEMSSQPLAQFSLRADTVLADSVDYTTVLVTLPDTLGQRFLDNAKDESNGHFRNNENFTKFFKGLSIVPDVNNSLLMEINPSSQSSYVRLRYNLNGNDTLLYFNMANANRSHLIESNRAGTPIANINEINVPDYSLDKLYLKSGAGLMGYIDLSDIYNIKDTSSGFVVNRAELVIDEDINYDTLKMLPPSLNIFLDADGFEFKSLSLPWRQNSFYSYSFRVSDSTQQIGNYITPNDVNLSTYLNSVITQGEDPKLYITPSSYATSAGQTILDKENLKLRLYFSYLK